MNRASDALRPREPASTSDADLIEAVQRGDSQAMAALFHRYGKLVYSISLRVLHDPGTAEDVMQDVLLQIWRTPTSFVSARGNLGAWLATISRNRSIDVLRKRRPSDSLDNLQLVSSADVYSDTEREVLLQRVKTAMAELPYEQRNALEMAYFSGCTHTEIAADLNHPLGTVKTRIKAALQTLRKAFEV